MHTAHLEADGTRAVAGAKMLEDQDAALWHDERVGRGESEARAGLKLFQSSAASSEEEACVCMYVIVREYE